MVNMENDEKIRNKENLTKLETCYIHKFSFGPVLWFVYTLLRKQYLIFVFLLVLQFLPYIYLNQSYFIIDKNIYVLMGFPKYIFIIIYSFFARRQSWNNCEWKSFSDFTISEKKWNIMGICFWIIVLVSLVLLWKSINTLLS